jgi:hypothetical protein
VLFLIESLQSTWLGPNAKYGCLCKALGLVPMLNMVGIYIHCDNESMVDVINKFRVIRFTKRFFYEAEADLIYAIIGLIRELETCHFQIQIRFVKGHQDRQSLPLTFPGFFNQQADLLATQSLQLRQVYSILVPSLAATLTINNLRVTSQHSHHIKTTFHSMDLRQHLQTSNHWTSMVLDDIWWDIHDKVLQQFPISPRNSLIKFLHKRWPCNQREARYYEYRPDNCVYCSEVIETQDHVLCCPCPKREILRMKYLSNLRVLLLHFKTNADLITVLLYYLEHWLTGNLPVPVQQLLPNPSMALIQAVEVQHSIGWGHFFKGRISIQWAYLFNFTVQQPMHIVTPLVDKWGKSILKLSMEFALTAWEIRNDLEHDFDGAVFAKKQKLVAKILWFISQIPPLMIPEYSDLILEDLIR